MNAVRLRRVIIQRMAQRLQLVTAQLMRVIIQPAVVHLRRRPLRAVDACRGINAVPLPKVIIRRVVVKLRLATVYRANRVV